MKSIQLNGGLWPLKSEFKQINFNRKIHTKQIVLESSSQRDTMGESADELDQPRVAL